jgi:hypothetical protein
LESVAAAISRADVIDTAEITVRTAGTGKHAAGQVPY